MSGLLTRYVAYSVEASRASISQSKTRRVSLTAILAAIYFVLRSIPTFQMIGIGGRFTAADFLPTTIALIVGLLGGTISVAVGTVLAYSMTPPVFLGLDFLPAMVNVAVVSLIASKRINAARILYLGVLLVFLVSPYSLVFGYGFIPFVWLHIIALLVLFSPLSKSMSEWLQSEGRKTTVAILLLALVGTMAQHLTGGLLYELAAGKIGGITPAAFAKFWEIIFWIYPVERALIIVFSTAIATVTQRSLRQMRTQFR